MANAGHPLSVFKHFRTLQRVTIKVKVTILIGKYKALVILSESGV